MTRNAGAHRITLLWIVAAAVAIPVRYFSAELWPANARAAARVRAYAPLIDADSIGGLAAAVAEAGLFDLPVADGANIISAAGPGIPAQGPPASRRVRLSAIVGPPWRAVIETEGPQGPPLVVEVGDTIRSRRVSRITSDSLVLRQGSSVFRYVVAESWLP